ncbi:MAG: hypothetical protein CM1200mP30_17740 [Pseudomonadota bacterium]|nr:MAG: hypothetical protein CM1200mP30_17740 [Pseudomonadota bacterium]
MDWYQWLFHRRGPAQPIILRQEDLYEQDKEKYPNIMMHFLPLAIRYDGSAPEVGQDTRFM